MHSTFHSLKPQWKVRLRTKQFLGIIQKNTESFHKLVFTVSHKMPFQNSVPVKFLSKKKKKTITSKENEG